MTDLEGQLGVPDLVVGNRCRMDTTSRPLPADSARRALSRCPPCRLRPLYSLAGGAQSAAVRGPIHRDVIEPQAVKDRRDRADHIGRAEDVAAEVQNDLVMLALTRGRDRAPLRLSGH